MRTPDLTPAQLVALVGSAIAVAVAFGAPISNEASTSILQLVTVLASVLLGADAVIRHGRATGKPAKRIVMGGKDGPHEPAKEPEA